MPDIRSASGFFTPPHDLLTCGAPLQRDPEKKPAPPLARGMDTVSEKIMLKQ
jgi:hypothetical protein